MKKIVVTFCLAAAFAGLVSCGSTKSTAVPADIDGSWNIVEINGTAVVPAPGQAFPNIGFDISTGRVSGNAGCNRLIGSFDPQAEAGTIDLSALGSTRMMCPDMTVEQNVLNALARVKHYVRLGENHIGLCGKSLKRPILVLQRKAPDATLADLAGHWDITEVGGVAVPDTLENRPFLEFDVAQKRVHGQTGCNLLNGAFQTEDGEPASIAFPQLISTMMACPDMQIEELITQALNATRTFGRLSEEGAMGFFDEQGTLVMTLQRK